MEPSWEILIVSIQPVLSQRKWDWLKRNRYKSHFTNFSPWKYKCSEHISEYESNLIHRKIVQWNLDGRTPFGNFGDRWVRIPKRKTCICKFRTFQPIKFPLRTNILIIFIWNYSKIEICRLTPWKRNAVGGLG